MNCFKNCCSGDASDTEEMIIEKSNNDKENINNYGFRDILDNNYYNNKDINNIISSGQFSNKNKNNNININNVDWNKNIKDMYNKYKDEFNNFTNKCYESNDNEEQLQNIKKKNSAIKIQRAYRAFQQKKKKHANICNKDINNNTIDNHENLEEIYNYDPKKLEDIFKIT